MEDTIKYFSQKELKSLFKAIQNSEDRHSLRNLCIFRIAYRCGLRASEIGLIKLEHYNKINKSLYCKRLKGSWNNTLILDEITNKILNKYIRKYEITDDKELLFKSQEKKPISRKTLDYLMKKYCIAADIIDTKKQHFHCLKHTVAVHLANSDLDIKEIQFWLSHKSINSTLCYFQFTSSQQKTLLKKLERKNMLI